MFNVIITTFISELVKKTSNILLSLPKDSFKYSSSAQTL